MFIKNFIKKQGQKSKTKPYVKREFIYILCFLVAFCSDPDCNDDSRVATPSFSPPGGEVLSTDALTISTATPEAAIYYTTDGSEPGDNTILYTAPVNFDSSGIGGEGSYTIKAIAIKEGLDNSAIAEAGFTVVGPQAAAPTFIPPGGDVESTASFMLATASFGADIYYTTDGSQPTTDSMRYNGRIGFNTIAGAMTPVTNITIKAIAVGGGRRSSNIAETTYRITLSNQVQAPVFSPANGAVFTTDLLTITSSTIGAAIHYTTDETDPSSSSTEYTGPVSFSSIVGDITAATNRTIRAIAIGGAGAGLNNSAIVEATFTVSQRDVDENNNGLMEIEDLDMLNNIRHNLAGTSYKISGSDSGSTFGAPTMEPPNCNDDDSNTTITLCGYELTRSLDFANAAHYASGNVNGNWRPNNSDPGRATNEGFDGFGAETGETGGFTGIFEGNGHTIGNLYSRNSAMTGKNIGLFRLVSSGGVVRNVGVTDVRIYGGGGNDDHAGGLVGRNHGDITASHSAGIADGGEGLFRNRVGGLVGMNGASGAIRASHATGNPTERGIELSYVGGLAGQNDGTITDSYAASNPSVIGGDESKYVGGLVGWNTELGRITASYATGNVEVRGGSSHNLGGLVGVNSGAIIASYATGNSHTTGGAEDNLGGLVGQNNSAIIASYATGNTGFRASSSASPRSSLGGLVGWNTPFSRIIASYANGNPSGREGDNDNIGLYIGGLVGQNNGGITASYATGNADGAAGDNDLVGGLVGRNVSGGITASYATGNADGAAGGNDRVGGLVGQVIRGAITASYAFGMATGGMPGNGGSAKPMGVTVASGLTAANAGMDSASPPNQIWNSATHNTLGAWNFGDSSQNPALVYADYDGSGMTTYACSNYPATIPGTTDPLTCEMTLLRSQRP